MARINGSEVEKVPADLQDFFKEQEKRYGSVLTTARVYALRPTIFKGVQALAQGIQASGLVAPELRHLVCFKVASLNGCPY